MKMKPAKKPARPLQEKVLTLLATRFHWADVLLMVLTIVVCSSVAYTHLCQAFR
jgi:hypothetical protein